HRLPRGRRRDPRGRVVSGAGRGAGGVVTSGVHAVGRGGVVPTRGPKRQGEQETERDEAIRDGRAHEPKATPPSWGRDRGNAPAPSRVGTPSQAGDTPAALDQRGAARPITASSPECREFAPFAAHRAA